MVFGIAGQPFEGLATHLYAIFPYALFPYFDSLAMGPRSSKGPLEAFSIHLGEDMKLKTMSVALAAPLLSCALAQAQTTTDLNISGTYQRAKPSQAQLQVVKKGLDWKVALVGAGLPRGEATASDCEMVAAGTLNGNVLIAHVVPFKGENISVDDDDLANGDHEFVIQFDAAGAKVLKDDVSFCGLGSDLQGHYVKHSSAKR
jgi:hypothetical protein